MKSRVLYIEPDTELGMSGMEALERSGVVVFYRTGTASLGELLEIWRPHLVLVGAGIAQEDMPSCLSSGVSGEGNSLASKPGLSVEYMAKPYTPDELVTRAQGRLAAGTMMDELSVGDFTYVPRMRQLRHKGMEMARLTPQMSKVFEILLRRQGEIVSTDFLLDSVWEKSVANRAQCLMNVIARLREVLRKDKLVVIKAVYKYGYMLYGRSASTD